MKRSVLGRCSKGERCYSPWRSRTAELKCGLWLWASPGSDTASARTEPVERAHFRSSRAQPKPIQHGINSYCVCVFFFRGRSLKTTRLNFTRVKPPHFFGSPPACLSECSITHNPPRSFQLQPVIARHPESLLQTRAFNVQLTMCEMTLLWKRNK